MSDARLTYELDRVGARYRRLATGVGLAACWLALAGLGLVALAWVRGSALGGWTVVGLAALAALPLVAVPLMLAAVRRARDPLWVARRVERRFADLDARLLAALEQRPDAEAGTPRQFGYLQQVVIDEAVDHARRRGWVQLVPSGRLAAAGWGHALSAVALACVVVALVVEVGRRPGAVAARLAGATTQPTDAGAVTIKVEPEDASVERGTSLLVLARFGDRLPGGDVRLLVRGADGQERETGMSKSLDDPVFAGRVPAVAGDLTYAVRYGGEQTRWFKVGTYEHPELRQADAKLAFPAYTGVPEKVVEDTRSVTAVEGTKATLTFRLNKPVADAALVPSARKPTTNPADAAAPAPAPVKLTVDPADPSVYTAAIDLKQSATYRLDLRDADGRASKAPAELAVNVVPNRPPDLKLEWPGKDVDVSPIEEMTVKAKVWDDFGVRRVGMSYGIAGKPPQDVVLAEGVGGKDRRDVAHTVALERLAAEPDQLLSYHLWVEDVGPDGAVRRTAGDMFFAEVRPFEEIFRQGQQPAGGEEEQQQQQGQQGGQNARQAEEDAEAQKQIIAATWKVIRRETSAAPTEQFAPDVKLIAQSQAELREKSAGMEERLTDARSKAHLKNVLKFMETAAAELNAAADGPDAGRLAPALSAEQAAYQELLKLRAREHEVVRSNRRQQQQSGQQSASSASGRRQRQLDQLRLSSEENRYQTQRQANAQQQQQAQQDPAQRETRQVLNRLRELAQRQEDLNRQMKELQSALAEAREQARQEELQRQLARLRDQQREMLRDTDELRDRMDQPENQERMAEARQQLEQTREDVRRAAEALDRDRVQEASASGARAGEQLDDLKEQFRRAASGQFTDAVNEMRQNARELDERQQELARELAEMDGAPPPQPRPDRAGQQPNDQRPQQPSAQASRPQPGDPQGGDPQAGGRQPGDPGQADARNGQPQQPGQPGQQAGQSRPRPPSLRGQDGRQQVAQDLQQQKERLEQLLEDMRKTVEEAEATEPLLSKQLYDAVRDTRQQRTDQALDATRQLVDRGFVGEARQAEAEATKGIARLREGVEQAAQGVLGDETEALRRARAELDALAQELEREMGRRGGTPSTRPSSDSGDGQLAQNGGDRNGQRPDGQPGGQDRQGQPGGRPGEDEQARAGAGQPRGGEDAQARAGAGEGQGERQPNGGAGADPSERQARGGTGATSRPSNPQLAQADQPRQPGGRQGDRQQEGQQEGQQPGERQNGEQAGDQPGGQQPGGEQQGSQPGGQQQASGQPGSQPGGQQQGTQPGGNQPGGQPGGRQPGGAQAGRQDQGQPQPGQEGDQPGESGQPSDAQANAQDGQQPGNQPGGRQPGRRGQPGLRGGNNDADGQQQPGDPRQQQAQAGGRRSGGNPNNRGGELGGPSAPVDEGGEQSGPLTGDNFRQWADRLRDVEEMVADPRLRAEAARIRGRARAVRAEADRHSVEPNWDTVRLSIGRPLFELRDAVAEELLRRQSPEALVPVDRDPVPPEYAEQVRRYYERLGSGK